VAPGRIYRHSKALGCGRRIGWSVWGEVRRGSWPGREAVRGAARHSGMPHRQGWGHAAAQAGVDPGDVLWVRVHCGTRGYNGKRGTPSSLKKNQQRTRFETKQNNHVTLRIKASLQKKTISRK